MSPKARNSQSPSRTPVIRQIPVTSQFKLVFLTTTVITIACILGSVFIAYRGGETESAKEVLSALLTLSKIGFGAIVGLLGGKSL